MFREAGNTGGEKIIDNYERRLLYVPIIHTEADLGSMGGTVAKSGRRQFGDAFWDSHEETVRGFWDALARYFDSIEVEGFKVFQDGMVAEGDMGRKIVEEVLKTGSKNYELLARLLHRGSILVRTEDIDLVKEEHRLLSDIAHSRTKPERLHAAQKYELLKNKLLDRRDRFIAGRIDWTLGKGETGILFIGAYHNVKAHLPSDVRVIEIKDAGRVMQYQRLLPVHNAHKKHFQELRRYLTAEVETMGEDMKGT